MGKRDWISLGDPSADTASDTVRTRYDWVDASGATLNSVATIPDWTVSTGFLLGTYDTAVSFPDYGRPLDLPTPWRPTGSNPDFAIDLHAPPLPVAYIPESNTGGFLATPAVDTSQSHETGPTAQKLFGV